MQRVIAPPSVSLGSPLAEIVAPRAPGGAWRRVPHLLLTLLLGLALISDAAVGIYQRSNCTSIASPVAGSTWCFDSTANALKLWDGTAWVSVVGGQALPSYTLAGLPPAGTAGRLADVTDSIGGIHKDTALQWIQIAGDIINVKDRPFGARGNSVANDTAAIQAAIDAASALNTAGTIIWLPSSAGAYMVNATLTVPAGKFVVFRGAGSGSILRWNGGNNTSMISYAGSIATPTRYAAVKFLQLHNGNAATGLTGVTFGDVGGTILGVTVQKVVFNALTTGVVVNNEGDEFSFYDNWFTGGGKGVRSITAGGCVTGCASSNHTYVGNHFQNLSDWAIDSDQSAKTTIIGNTIQSSTAGAKGIQLNKTTAPTILSNYFEWQTTPTGTAVSINPTTAGTDSLGGGQISDNVFNLNNATTGVLIANISGLKVGRNTWRLVGTAITLQNTASFIDVEIQSTGTGVTTVLSSLWTYNLNTDPAYGTTVAINAANGNLYRISATNGVAFTISNPTNSATGQRFTIMVRNTSGGALGAVTWGTLYKLAAWTNPADLNNRSITYVNDGTNFVEVSRTTTDVPN